MLRAAAATPRKKFPPPTTRPICTPVRATSATSTASASTRDASMPKEPSPASTSPEIFSRMRWYLDTGMLFCHGGLAGFAAADLEADEAGDGDVFAELRDLALDQVGDGGGVFLDEGLLVEADLLEVFIEA